MQHYKMCGVMACYGTCCAHLACWVAHRPELAVLVACVVDVLRASLSMLGDQRIVVQAVVPRLHLLVGGLVSGVGAVQTLVVATAGVLIVVVKVVVTVDANVPL